MSDWPPLYASGFTDGLYVGLASFWVGFVVTLLVRFIRGIVRPPND